MEKVSFHDHISANKRNSFFLVIVVLVLIVFLGYFIGLVLTLITFVGGDGVVLSTSGAKPANKHDHAHLINTVEGLSIAAGIPMPKVYVIEDQTINAFAIGRKPEKASVAVTTGALQKLNRVELEGVIAHELSHVKNYDVLFMMITVVMVGIVIMLSDVLLRSFIFGGSRDDEDNKGMLVFIAVGIFLAILAPIAGQLIKLAVSRKREFLADANGALLTRHPAV